MSATPPTATTTYLARSLALTRAALRHHDQGQEHDQGEEHRPERVRDSHAPPVLAPDGAAACHDEGGPEEG